MFRSLPWPAVHGLGVKAAGSWFSCIWCLPPLGDAGLEACAGFLEGRANSCSVVGGAGSWSFGGQSHV